MLQVDQPGEGMADAQSEELIRPMVKQIIEKFDGMQEYVTTVS